MNTQRRSSRSSRFSFSFAIAALLAVPALACDTDEGGAPSNAGAASGKADELEGGSSDDGAAEPKAASASCKAMYLDDVDPNVDIALSYDEDLRSFVGHHEAFSIRLSVWDDTHFDVAIDNEETHWGSTASGFVATDGSLPPGLSFAFFDGDEDTGEFVLSNVVVRCSTSPDFGGTPVHP